MVEGRDICSEMTVEAQGTQLVPYFGNLSPRLGKPQLAFVARRYNGTSMVRQVYEDCLLGR
jgi:hypothetical protein